MALANINMQARDPERTGRFWAGALGLVDAGMSAPDLFEGRMDLGEFFLDVCIDRVSGPPPPGWRLHLDLFGGAEQHEVVE